jgi:uncharacterized protein YndB with AHSA1/START domain
MIVEEPYGTITPEDPDHATIRFERRLPARIERVWAALSDPGELATWLSTSSVELRLGGTIEHVFDASDESQRVHGTIIEIEPMTRLEYEWHFPGEPDSVLRYELTADGDETILKLTHRMLGLDQVSGYGAGWHTYLDALEAVLSGQEPADWDARFAAVRAAYATVR